MSSQNDVLFYPSNITNASFAHRKISIHLVKTESPGAAFLENLASMLHIRDLEELFSGKGTTPGDKKQESKPSSPSSTPSGASDSCLELMKKTVERVNKTSEKPTAPNQAEDNHKDMQKADALGRQDAAGKAANIGDENVSTTTVTHNDKANQNATNSIQAKGDDGKPADSPEKIKQYYKKRIDEETEKIKESYKKLEQAKEKRQTLLEDISKKIDNNFNKGSNLKNTVKTNYIDCVGKYRETAENNYDNYKKSLLEQRSNEDKQLAALKHEYGGFTYNQVLKNIQAKADKGDSKAQSDLEKYKQHQETISNLKEKLNTAKNSYNWQKNTIDNISRMASRVISDHKTEGVIWSPADIKFFYVLVQDSTILEKLSGMTDIYAKQDISETEVNFYKKLDPSTITDSDVVKFIKDYDEQNEEIEKKYNEMKDAKQRKENIDNQFLNDMKNYRKSLIDNTRVETTLIKDEVKRVEHTIVLPVPTNLQDKYSQEWVGVARPYVSTVDTAFGNKLDAIQQAYSMGKIINQVKLNKDNHLSWTGTSLRSFTFTWDLIPDSVKEAENILKIIQKLKMAQSPQQMIDKPGEGAGVISSVLRGLWSNAMIIEPYRVMIVFGNPVLHASINPKLCVISDIDVGYTTESTNAVETTGDGVPRSFTLSVTFKEVSQQYQSDFDDKKINDAISTLRQADKFYSMQH